MAQSLEPKCALLPAAFIFWYLASAQSANRRSFGMNAGSWFWPDVSDMGGAEDACRLAKWCAVAVAGLTAILALVSITGPSIAGLRPFAFVDAAIFAVIAFGLEKQSRVAAVAGFVLYLSERIYMVATTGSILGAGALGIVILIGFLNGIRGAFAIARLKASSASVSSAATGS
jgi:hypothetical protein